MARVAHPWYWEERDGWYVTKDGQRHLLGGHPENAPPPRKTRGKWNAPEAIRLAFHALMVAPPPTPAAAPVTASNLSVARLFDRYLDWCQRHREKRTYTDYLWHLQRFCEHLESADRLPALDLRPFHVNEWLDAHPDWGQTYRRNAIASVKRAYTWAEEEGYIEHTPLRRLKKPMPKRREQVITPEEYKAIIGCYKPGNPFREFLEFCWASGCRPIEARLLEGRHVNLERKLVAIPPGEAKGRKRWRVIRLEGRALELAQKRLTEGRLFVNRDGRPWTTFSINCRFCRLKDKLGVKYFAYAFRHSFAQRLLVDGVDHLTVAELLGHADGTMLAKVYAHMDQADGHLREALKRA